RKSPEVDGHRLLRFYTVWAGSSPSLPDGSNPSAAIVQSASDVQCSRLLKTTVRIELPSELIDMRRQGS
ncbi:hypothetical protein VUS62_08990, partial [Pseudomonas aeruginosa]|uniref:hypothetical protein n=1 Tax=Pseudomonas aeruginosa TaxID=287 RepID=UPI00300486A2